MDISITTPRLTKSAFFSGSLFIVLAVSAFFLSITLSVIFGLIAFLCLVSSKLSGTVFVSSETLVFQSKIGRQEISWKDISSASCDSRRMLCLIESSDGQKMIFPGYHFWDVRNRIKVWDELEKRLMRSGLSFKEKQGISMLDSKDKGK